MEGIIKKIPYFQSNPYVLRSFLCIWILFVGYLCHAQRIHIPSIDSSLNHYYYNFDSKQAYSHHKYGDTVKMKIKIPNVDFQPVLFSGDAELASLTFADTSLYSGKYMPRKKLYSKKDICFFVIPNHLKGQYAEFMAYNISHRDFYIAPIIITKENFDIHQMELYQNSQLSIYNILGFIGGCSCLLLFFIGMYIIDRQVNDYLYFALYILGVIVHNMIQADSYLRSYYLFPNHPEVYHQIFEAHIVFNYFLFILFIRKFLKIDEEYPSIAKKMDFILIAFLGISLTFLYTGIIANNLEALENKLFFLFIVCILIGIYLIYLFKTQVKNDYLRYTILGSTILVSSSTIEFILARVFKETYNWNLQYPILGGISPANFTQYGNWLNIMFFAMMIGFKYKVTEKGIKRFRLKKLNQLEGKNKIEENKLNELKKIESFQSEQLFEKNNVFGSLQSQYGNVKQQFNPEFIENMLEAINFNIKIDKKNEAKEQISLLKEFLERILKYSNRDIIPGKEDARNIEIFVLLDRYRLQNLFDLEMNVAPEIEDPRFLCPSFLFQEYLEIIMRNHFDKFANKNLIKIDIEIIEKQIVVKIAEKSDKKLQIREEEILEALDNIQGRILKHMPIDSYSLTRYISEDEKFTNLELRVNFQFDLNDKSQLQ